MPEAKHHRQPVEQEISRGRFQRASARALRSAHSRGGRARAMAHINISRRLRFEGICA